MKELRVAFCFSGQLRTWKECYPSWLKFASKFDTPPDIFCHIWDFNSNSARIMNITNEQGINQLAIEEIDEFLNIINPSKYVIDGLEKSYEVTNEICNIISKLTDNAILNGSVDWVACQFYSNMHSAFLKHEYELENGFEYDLCFKMRYDMLFSELNIHVLFDKPTLYNNEYISFNGPNQNTLYTIHSGKLDVWPFISVGDVFYYADSQMFDKISLFYYRLPYIFVKSFKCKIVKPEIYLYFYLKSILGKHIPISIDAKIVRDERYEEVVKSVTQELYNCDIIIKKNV